jgi:hypothetical protein
MLRTRIGLTRRTSLLRSSGPAGYGRYLVNVDLGGWIPRSVLELAMANVVSTDALAMKHRAEALADAARTAAATAAGQL